VENEQQQEKQKLTRTKQTQIVHDIHDEQHQGAVAFPIYQNSLFTFATVAEYESAAADQMNTSVYTRGTNPTVRELEKKLAALEGAEQARCFSSGMAAISSAILSVVQSGDHIVCVDQAYGPTRSFISTYLPKFKVEYSFVDGTSLETVRAAIKPNTKLLYLESPSSHLFSLQDIAACAELAHEAGALVLIDNTWATPLLQNPLALGVDLVMHSLTKYIGGHSDTLGGVVIGSNALMEKLFYNEFMHLGGIMTPHTANLVMRGLRSMPVRLKHQQESAFEVARFLESIDCVCRVSHPGLPSHPQYELGQRQMLGYSSLFAFETDLSVEQLKNWANHLELFRIGVSWGGYESLVMVNAVQPAQGTSHARLYIGLEDPQDIIADLTAAFAAINVQPLARV